MNNHNQNHDVVVIGASAGSVETVPNLLSQLPADFPASVFVVIHMSPDYPSMLHQIIKQKAVLDVQQAKNNHPIHCRNIYTAIPNHHLLVKMGYMFLSHGPRENHARPAIDPLFRSAAVSYSSRVIGVILTGYLDDGASGLEAIKRCGGMAVVQDPGDAVVPDMPRNAISRVASDHVVPVSEMGSLLVNLASIPATAVSTIPQDIIDEVKIAEGDVMNLETTTLAAEPAPLVCPECGGSLWEIQSGEDPRYRCNLGHGYTFQSLVHSQYYTTEESLWRTYRTFEQYLRLLQQMLELSKNNPMRNAKYTTDYLWSQMEKTRKKIETLRTFLSDTIENSEPPVSPSSLMKSEDNTVNTIM